MLSQFFAPTSQVGEAQASSAFEARTAYWTNVGTGLIALAHRSRDVGQAGGAA